MSSFIQRCVLKVIVAALVLISIGRPAHAFSILEGGQNGVSTINFSSYISGTLAVQSATGGFAQIFGSSPLSLYSTDNYNSGIGYYGLGNNGQWNGVAQISLVDQETIMAFEIPTAVNMVGIYMNYATPVSGSGIEVTAIDNNLNQLSPWYVLPASAPISTPGGSDMGQWIGIYNSSPDIYGIAVQYGTFAVGAFEYGGSSGGYTPSSGGNNPPGFFSPEDDEPEPGSLLLMGGGFLGLALRRRR